MKTDRERERVNSRQFLVVLNCREASLGLRTGVHGELHMTWKIQKNLWAFRPHTLTSCEEESARVCWIPVYFRRIEFDWEENSDLHFLQSPGLDAFLTG